MESMLSKQLMQTEDNLTRKMDEIINKLEEIGQYCRIKKMENDNMEIVLRILESYRIRLENLEMKML